MEEPAAYAIGSEGPFSEAELRARLKSHREANGEAATLALMVVQLPRSGGSAGRDLDVSQFLD